MTVEEALVAADQSTVYQVVAALPEGLGQLLRWLNLYIGVNETAAILGACLERSGAAEYARSTTSWPASCTRSRWPARPARR